VDNKYGRRQDHYGHNQKIDTISDMYISVHTKFIPQSNKKKNGTDNE